MGKIESVRSNFHCLTPYFFALCNTCTLLDRPAERTSSFYLKPWPVHIFEDLPFSLYIVAASKSNEVLVIPSAFDHCTDVQSGRGKLQTENTN